MPGVGTLAVYLTGNASRFNKTMAGAQRTLKSFSRSVSGIGGLLAGALGGVGLGMALKTSLNAYTKQEDALSKLAAVLRATGGAAGLSVKELHKYAGELQNVTTFGDEAIEGAMGILATFKEIKGDVFKGATKAILDLSAVLGQDAKAGAIQLGKALNDPIQGVTALRRVGVSFTQEQLKQIANFQKAGDMVAAQQVILTELQSEFGGAAEALAKTTAGKIKQMGNAFGDVKEQIGFILVEGFKLPELLDYVKSKLAGVQKWFESGAAMKWFIETKYVFLKIGAVLAVFGENIATQIDWIGENWGKLWHNNLEIVGAVARDITNYLINSAQASTQGMLSLFGAFFGNMLDGYKFFFGKIMAGYKALWDFIKSGGKAAVFANMFEERKKAFADLFTNAKERFAEAGQTLIEGAANTIGEIGRETEAALAKAGVSELKLQGLDEILEKFSELDRKKLAEMAAISPAFADLLTDAIRQAPPVPVEVEPVGPMKFAAAVEQGTLEAYKAEIGKSTIEQDQLSVLRQQLSIQQKQLDATRDAAAGGYELAEIGV